MVSESALAPAPATDRHAQLRLIASVMVPAWGRAVVVLVGTAVLLGVAPQMPVSAGTTEPGTRQDIDDWRMSRSVALLQRGDERESAVPS